MMPRKWSVNTINANNIIYVIGIMKAGKSTFINLLLQKILEPNYNGCLTDKNKILDVDPGECTYMETQIEISHSINEEIEISPVFREWDIKRKKYIKKSQITKSGKESIRKDLSDIQRNVEDDKIDYTRSRMPWPKKNKKGGYILRELSELKIKVSNQNVPDNQKITLIDTPGFDSSAYKEANMETLINIHNASKIIVVVQIEKLEARQLLKKIIESINNSYKDIPRILIVNIKEYREEDFKDRIDIVVKEFIEGKAKFDRAYFINIQDALTVNKMGLTKYCENDNIRIIDNGEFTIDIWKEILTTPEEYFSDVIKRILAHEYRIINYVEVFNKYDAAGIKSKIREIITGASIENTYYTNDEEKVCQDIQVYLTRKTEEYIKDIIEDNEYYDKDDGKIYFKIQKEISELFRKIITNKEYEEIREDIAYVEGAVAESAKLLLEKQLRSGKDNISSLTHKYVNKIRSMLEGNASARNIVESIKEEYSNSVCHIILKYYSIWKAYTKFVNRIYIKYQVNKIIIEQIKSSKKYEK